ncbi:MAG: tetratricopeptide repeat protein, partial [Pyrinomonadaceae bacterium]
MFQLAKRFCVLAVMVFGSTWATTPVCAKTDWVRIRSANFTVIGNADLRQMREIATRLEQFREATSTLLPTLTKPSPVPTTVMVFNNLTDYAPFRPGNAAGHFMPGRDVNYIALAAEGKTAQAPYGILFHEYTHQLLHDSPMRDIPAWLNEGLAEYYSTFTVNDDQHVTVGRVIPGHLFILGQRNVLPLETLFAVDTKSPYYNEDQKQTIFYAQSWLLVHYLIQGDQGARQSQLARFVDLLLAKTPVEQAFQQAFQLTFSEMERELQVYAKAGGQTTTTIALKQKLTSGIVVSSEPIDETVALAYQGDLLFHMHRAEAENYLKQALVRDPKQKLALTSLGLLFADTGRTDLAAPMLERALAQDGGNYFLQFRYAEALLRETERDNSLVASFPPERLARIRASLKTAIELRPTFTDSYRVLAYLSLLDNVGVADSITLLQRALALAPDRYELIFMLGQCYLNLQDLERARTALAAVAKNGGTDEMRRQAMRILGNITELEELRRSSKAQEVGRVVVPNPETDQPIDPGLRDEGVLALRPLNEGEIRVRGELAKIECTGGRSVVLVVISDGRTLRFHSVDLSSIRFATYSTSVTGGMPVSCGALPAPNTVLATYRPNFNARSRIDGEAVA